MKIEILEIRKMSKIYLHGDISQIYDELANYVIPILKEDGHEVTSVRNTDEISESGDEGIEFRKRAIHDADIIISVFPNRNDYSKNFLRDVDITRKVVLPKDIADKISSPKKWLALFDGNVNKSISNPLMEQWDVSKLAFAKTARDVANFVIACEKEWYLIKEGREDTQKKLQSNVADFVKEAIDGLEKRKTDDERIASWCYGTGFGALIICLVMAFWVLKDASTIPQIEWLKFAVISVKTAFLIGLAIACSRYAFHLGSSFMNEARKSADRIHAIRFGKFYLQAFGDKAEWEQVKEVFQHWNIDKDSIFATLKADDYDPKFTEKIVDLAKAALEKGK